METSGVVILDEPAQPLWTTFLIFMLEDTERPYSVKRRYTAKAPRTLIRRTNG
jgi:hypothetical protein